jgi:hypothetical protein
MMSVSLFRGRSSSPASKASLLPTRHARRLLSRAFLPAVLQPLESRTLFAATTYFVAPAPLGNDSYSGVSATQSGGTGPFATISQAVKFARAGDTIQIRSGTYRETVTFPSNGSSGSLITIRNYPGETPVISGADLITSNTWTTTTTAAGATIYKAPMNWTLGGVVGSFDDQLFLDGQMLNYARYPNTSLDILHPTMAYAAAGTTGTLSGTLTCKVVDPNLNQPTNYWKGAVIHINTGPQWIYETAVITSSSPGTLTYTSTFGSDKYVATPGNPYFLSGPSVALDSPGEYYANGTNAYLWTPASDNPALHTVEAKKRTWALDLSNRRYISVKGISIFAAGILTNSSSNNITLDSLSAKYVAHFNGIDGNWDSHMLDNGIVIAGNNITLSNSEINFSAGNGVSLSGSTNTITGNFIHNVDYSGRDNAGIATHHTVPVTNNTISFNTLSDSPRGLILFRGETNSKIVNNRLFNAMLWTTDGGAIYTWGASSNYPSTGMEIARNVISDVFQGNTGNPGAGIFLDGSAPGATIHHNVVYNANNGLKNNDVVGAINYYNNTAYNTPSGAIYAVGTQANGSLINNLTSDSITRSNVNTITYTTNLTTATAATFAGASTYNFQLASTATNAIDSGSTITSGGTNYTSGAIGTPDIGAYEFGSNAFTAGTTNSFVSAIPAAPSGLSATVISPTQVNLTFTNNASNATRFIIDRGSTDSNGDIYFQQLAAVTNIASGTNNFSDTSAPTGPIYYRVRVDNGYTTSPYTYQAYALARRDAFQTIYASTVDAVQGTTPPGTSQIGSFDKNDWVLFKSVDFQSLGANAVTFDLASPGTAGPFQIRIDNVSGTSIGSVTPINTGGFGSYATQTATTSLVTGIHDVYLVGSPTSSSGIANIRSLIFDKYPAFSSIRINDGNAQRSMVKSVVLTFDTPVTLPASAISLTNTSNTFLGTVSVSPTSGLASTFTLTFSGTTVTGGSLPDGIYSLALTSSQILNSLSEPLTGYTPQTFHRLFGDVNGDGRVNATDQTAITAAYGYNSSNTNYKYYFDFDTNNAINNTDLIQFRKRLNSALF